ncbi:hypothetical protein containing WD40 repeat [Thermococcus cleftensis]|uniref:PEGA domain-containing protein n=1 Tax=Thermococcus cleftensis (strain DSM 27260 / KACC 17922 / CL1) TaxID=163003 RepID=I3ZW35_THECF|nr:PEGA domain-containing protein [Thermococcus cleftensis]AFL95919.1 hypothetical protein containing WD40 repeat [Thermococcus cleftensis]
MKWRTAFIIGIVLISLLGTAHAEASAPQITPEWTYTVNTEVYAIKVGPNGQYVVAGGKNGRIYYFSWDGRPIWDYLTGGFIASLDIAKDGKNIVAAVGYDTNRDGSPEYGKIIYLDDRKHVLWTYTSQTKEFFSSVSAGQDRIYVGSEGKIIRFSYTGSRIATNLVGVDLPEVDAYGNYLAVSHSPWFYRRDDNEYSKLFLFSGTFLKSTREFDDAVVGTAISEKYYAAVTGLHLDPSGKWTGSGNYYAYLYRLSGEFVWRYKLDAPAFDVDITPSGNIIAVGDTGGNVYVFNENGYLLWKGNVGSPVYAVALSQDGNYLAVGTKDGTVALFRVPGVIQILTDPSDAQVYLMENGEYTRIGKTPVAFAVLPGTYAVKVAKEYYHTKVVEVSVSPGDVVKEYISLPLANGTINVYSNVDGAQVVIDGIPVGKTPLLNYTIPAGDHNVTVRANGFCGDYREEVSINSPTPVAVTARLEPCPAKLEINEPSGAEVYVDGAYYGTAPTSISIQPGSYEVVLKKEGRKDYTTTVSLGPGETRELLPNMQVDPVYYGVRAAAGIAVLIVLLLLVKAYRGYRFRTSYKELLAMIDSAKRKNVPEEAGEILEVLEGKRKAVEEAYHRRDRKGLERLRKEIAAEVQRVIELSGQYRNMKERISRDIMSLLNQPTAGGPSEGEGGNEE